jgi:hypothetical protein
MAGTLARTQLWGASVVVVGSLMCAACGTSVSSGVQRPRSTTASSTGPTTSSTTAPASTTTTAPCIAVAGCVAIDPNTYKPTYDTVTSLAYDSTMAFIGTAQPPAQDPVLGTATPFTIDQVIWGNQPETTPIPAIPEGGSGDITATAGQEYLVFWAIDLTGPQETECVVGGMRGLFSYDPETQMLTRTATSTSQIPNSLSLSQLETLLPDPNTPVPIRVPAPPICSSAVTGLSSSSNQTKK